MTAQLHGLRRHRKGLRIRRWHYVPAVILACLALLAQTTDGRTCDEKQLRFTVPAAPWTLILPGENFELQQEQYKPDGRSGYFMLTDDRSHLNVSFFIEPVGNCGDSKACRDMVWKLGNPAWGKPKNVVQSDLAGVYFVEFLVPSFENEPIAQQNMYAEFVVDGFWVDLHISKILYKPDEHKLFEELVKSIKFEPKTGRHTD